MLSRRYGPTDTLNRGNSVSGRLYLSESISNFLHLSILRAIHEALLTQQFIKERIKE